VTLPRLCRRDSTLTDTVTVRAPDARARVERLRVAEGLDSRSAALHWLLMGWEQRQLEGPQSSPPAPSETKSGRA
jgi:hypothetical protein